MWHIAFGLIYQDMVNILKGEGNMEPKIIEKEALLIAGVSGGGDETAKA